MRRFGFYELCVCITLQLASLIVSGPFSNAHALEKPGDELAQVGVEPLLGTQVDLSLGFTTADGQVVTIKSITEQGKPVIIVPVYYHCPRLCGLLLNGFVDALNKQELNLGSDYQVLTVSFDSEETPEQAAKRRAEFKQLFKHPELVDSNWHFAVGNKDTVSKLMTQIGFRYMPDQGEFAHSAAIIILTSEGKISQYFTGVTFPKFDLRLALVEASEGRIGSALDHILLFCFRFDSTVGRYTWAAVRFMQLSGAFVFVGLVWLVVGLRRKEQAQKRALV